MTLDTVLRSLAFRAHEAWSAIANAAPAERHPIAETHRATALICWRCALDYAADERLDLATAELQLALDLVRTWDPAGGAPEREALAELGRARERLTVGPWR